MIMCCHTHKNWPSFGYKWCYMLVLNLLCRTIFEDCSELQCRVQDCNGKCDTGNNNGTDITIFGTIIWLHPSCCSLSDYYICHAWTHSLRRSHSSLQS